MTRDRNVIEGEAAKAVWVALGAKLSTVADELAQLALKMQTSDVAEGTLSDAGAAALYAALTMMVLRGDSVPEEMVAQARAASASNFRRHMSTPCSCPNCVAERAKPLRERVPNAKLH